MGSRLGLWRVGKQSGKWLGLLWNDVVQDCLGAYDTGYQVINLGVLVENGVTASGGCCYSSSAFHKSYICCFDGYDLGSALAGLEIGERPIRKTSKTEESFSDPKLFGAM